MKNEKNQKKNYSAPKMKQVKLRHQANLMSCSDSSDPSCTQLQ